MKHSEQRKPPDTCFPTDDSLGWERARVDQPLAKTSLGHVSSLDEVGRQTDLLPSSERAEIDSALWASATLLTQERKARSAADAALENREGLLAIFAHDLRNLLNALTINAELLLRQNGETGRKSATNIQLTIRRMDQLVSSLLDLARLDAGKLTVAPQARDAAELVREAVEIFRPLADAKSVALSVRLPDAPLPAWIDADRIFQVLSNLLANAIQFSTRNGRICVSASKVGEVVQVAVGDTGPGIAKRDLERVFERYRQGNGSNGHGLGLGLFISKSIVQAHGGQIRAESKPGAGSTFFFTVPGINGAPRGEASH